MIYAFLKEARPGSGKKYEVELYNMSSKIPYKKIFFGAEGYQDYTTHHDKKRKYNYMARNRENQNWKRTGITTPGFWSRWLLWNKPSIEDSIDDIERRFNIDIEY